MIAEFLPPPEKTPEPSPRTPARAGPSMINGEKEKEKAELEPAPVPGKSEPKPKAGRSEEDIHHEGMLIRKHDWESTTKRVSSRHWDKVYTVLHGTELSFYKDQKHAKADPTSRFRGEQPVNLTGASCGAAKDYKKRPHVLQLKLSNGGEFLLQCKDDDEMNLWMTKINANIGEEGALPSRSQTLPAKSDSPAGKAEPKKRSFFTLGKKKN